MKRTLQNLLTVLTAAGICAAAMPFPASAGTLSKEALEEALIEKYAEYAYAEARASIPAAGGIARDSRGAASLLETAVLVALPDGTTAQSTLGAELNKAVPDDRAVGIFRLNGFRFDCKDNEGRHWQFFRNCRYENGFWYLAASDGTADIVGCDTAAFLAKGSDTLDLPETLGGMTVTRIHDYAFQSIGAALPGLAQINLPDTVETVGIAAFYDVGTGVHIRLSQRLKAIQRRAFQRSEAAVSDEFGVIALPGSLEFLGYEVFSADYRAARVDQQSHYILRMPSSPVYLDEASYRGDVLFDNPAATIRDIAAIYSDPVQYFGEAQWALIRWSRGEITREDVLPYFAAEYHDRLDEFRTADFENTVIAAYERGKAYIDALADSGKYDIDRPFWTGGFQYADGGSALYGEYNVVTKTFPANHCAAAELILPGTDGSPLTPQATGDLDQNGTLDITDAVLAARSAALQSDAPAADLDGDGILTDSDLAILSERILLLNQSAQPQSRVRGDADLNGSFGIADAVLTARYLAEDKTARIGAQGLANADLDGDGNLTAQDYWGILQALAALNN